MAIQYAKSTKYAAVAQQLRADIAAKRWSVGERLPVFTVLQEQFGVTQKTLEQALTVLEREGLIVRKPRSGVFVAPPPEREALGIIGCVSFGAIHAQSEPYWSQILAGIRAGAAQAGMQVLLIDGDRPDEFAHWEKLDGALLTQQPQQAAAHRWPLGMPRVSLLHAVPGIPGVVADDFGAGQLATQHLLALGHRRIAFLGVQNEPLCARRLGGYRAALQSAGIEPEADWIKSVVIPSQPNPFIPTAQRAVQEWRCGGCTALIAQNDAMALGAVRGLRRLGLSVPRDVNVLSFDGTEVCEHTEPTLTSATLPLFQIGQTGAQLLMELIREGAAADNEERVIMLPAKITVRESTAPLA